MVYDGRWFMRRTGKQALKIFWQYLFNRHTHAGLMVYEGTQALDYVKNYAQGTSQWDGFPIKVLKYVLKNINFELLLYIGKQLV
jgi:hypothetical protein